MGIKRSQCVYCFFEEIVLQDENRGGLKSKDSIRIMEKCFGYNV